MRLLTGTTNPLSAAAVSCKGAPFWHMGQQLRDITKKLRHETTTDTLSLGKLSLVIPVVLPRDFQLFALDKKTQKEAITVISLSPSPSLVLPTPEFNNFRILPTSCQLTQQLSEVFPAR